MAFNLPNGLYSYPKTQNTYTRPSDWPAITDTAGEVQMLFADTGQATISLQITFTGVGGAAVVIDWGDSTTTTVSVSGSTFYNHTYTKGTGTSCSRGYTTFKIRVYPVSGATISTVKPGIDNTIGIHNQSLALGLLEVYYGDGTQLSGIPSYFTSTTSGPNSATNFEYLEYVKMPSTVNSAVSYSYAFSYCTNLKKVDLPTSSPGNTTWTSTFTNCSSLLSVIFPSDTNPTTINSTFTACVALTSVVFPTSLNSCTTLASAFASCYALTSLVIPSIAACTSLNAAFTACYNLTSITFLGLPAPASPSTAIDCTNMLLNCYKLEIVNLPTCSTNGLYNMTTAFSACYSLRTITLPAGMNVSNFTNAFQNCYNLQYADIIGNGTMTGLTNLNNCFNNCYLISIIKLPTGSTTTLTATTFLLNCFAIESLSIPSGLGAQMTSCTIQACRALKSYTLPSSMNSCATFNISTCDFLTDLTLPTSMSACSIFTISACSVLKTLTLPTTLPSNMTSLAIQYNYALEKINNMPATIAMTNYSAAFTGNYSLRSLTLPSSSVNITSFSSAFASCYALETLVLPSTQNASTTTVTLTNMIQNCVNLTTLSNFDKIQSTSAASNSDASGFSTNLIPGLTFSQKLTKLVVNGATYQSQQNRITALRHTNTSTGQWTGTSPQIDITYTNITYANLVTFFNDIAAQGTVTSKTINITGCVGAGSLTAADRLILTSKGWTITG